MSHTLVYFLIFLGKISVFAIAISILLGICAVVSGIVYWMVCAEDSEEKYQEAAKNWVKRFSVALMSAILLSLVTPSLKESAAIYLIPKVVNNREITNVSSKGMKLLSAALDKWIEELSPPDNLSAEKDL